MGKDEIKRITTISEYNAEFDAETLNPLVTVVDFSNFVGPAVSVKKSYDFYLVMLKDTKCADILYGRNKYDFQEELVFLAPGQVYSVVQIPNAAPAKGFGLAFHPDLLRGTSLGRNIHDYSFSPTMCMRHCTCRSRSVAWCWNACQT